MLRRGENFIPIAKVDHPALDWKLELPGYVDPDSILVNPRRIAAMGAVGAIESIAVEERTGPRSTRHFNILGEAGGAIVGFAAREAAPLHSITAKTAGPASLPPYESIAVTIGINTGEIADRIAQDRRGKGSVRDPGAWADYLDDALCNGIREVVREHSLKFNREQITALWGVNLLVAPALTLGLLYPPWLPWALREALGVAAFTEALFMSIEESRARYSYHLPWENSREVIAPNTQLLRRIAINGLSRAIRLVKAR